MAEVDNRFKTCAACEQKLFGNRFRKLSDRPVVRHDVCMSCERAAAPPLASIPAPTGENVAAKVRQQRDKRDDKAAAREIRMARKRNATARVKAKEKEHKAALQDNAAAKELARRELARRSLLQYILRFNAAYQPGWVHEDICRRLERFLDDVTAGKGPRLMLFMPPRHGKSKAVSEEFPSWALGKYPDLEVIACSYGITLPLDFSRKVRARIRDEEYQQIFEGTRIDPEHQNVEGWTTTEGGGYRPAGVGSGVTGKGADILLVDDPFKDAEEADSETIRQAVWDWWGSTAYTRLSPKSGALIIQCMTGDTPVTMADGSWKPLADIRAGDMVMAWKDQKLVPRRVLNWAPQGEDDVFEIRTGSSRVRANARHPFLFRSAKGMHKWVRVEDFGKVGVNNKLVHAGMFEPARSAPPVLTTQEAWLLGYMFGDGWITARNGRNHDRKRATTYPRRGFVTCVAASEYPEEDRRVQDLVEEVTGVRMKLTKYGYYRTEKQVVGRWFVDRGLVGKAKTKRLPQYLYAEPLEVRRAFLNGHNAADGCEHRTWNRSTFGIANYELARDLRHLARGCGHKVTNISSQYGEIRPPNSPAPVQSECHRVSWNSAETAEFYYRAPTLAYAGRAVVYDMQVEDAECFVADGFISHNTRWHDDDMSGRLIAQMMAALREIDETCEVMAAEGALPEAVEAYRAAELETVDRWEIVSYPAIAETDEYLTSDHKTIDHPEAGARPLRKKGEALHPARYPIARLRRIKRALQPRHWSALYQQNPIPDEGTLFTKGMLHYSPSPDWRELPILISVDLAIGKKQENDYTVIGAGCIDHEDVLHLLAARRERIGTFQIVEAILDMYERFKGTTQSVTVGIERGQLQLAIWDQLAKRMQERKLYPSFDQELKPVTDKVVRARPLQGQMQQGKVCFVPGQPWTEQVTNELLRFPNGVFDDYVDMLAWMARMRARVFAPKRKAAKRPKSWRDKLSQYVKDQAGSGSAMAA